MQVVEVWTVVQVAEGDTLPWNTSYKSSNDAERDIRQAYNEAWGSEPLFEITENKEYNHDRQRVFKAGDEVWFVTPTVVI